MRDGRVTLLDVARHAGVSRTTASFVLAGRTDMRISADTADRVRRAARELSYRPNLLASSMRTGVTKTVGFVSDVVASEPFAGDMVRAAIEAALLHDHLLLVGETQGDPTVEDRVVKAMLDRAVSGFIYASMFTRQVRVSRVLRAHRLVLLNCTSQSQSLPAVVPDEHAAGVAAATALLTAGHHQRIFLIGETPSSVYAAEKRRAGIEQTLTAAGTALAGAVDCRWWPEPAYDATHALLADGARPSAVICLNDRVAMGVYQALNDAGLTIPTDISVVSFDDSDLAAWLRPALTSVALPHYDMGRRAIELLLTTATIGPQPPIPMPLRHRGSISHPPQL